MKRYFFPNLISEKCVSKNLVTVNLQIIARYLEKEKIINEFVPFWNNTPLSPI